MISNLGFATAGGEVRADAALSVDGRKIQEPLTLPALLQSTRIEAAVRAAEAPLVRLLAALSGRDSDPPGAATRSEGNVGGPSGLEGAEDAEADVRKILDFLVAQRYLLLENGVYKAQAGYDGGLLKLNGQAIRIDRLLER